MVKIIYKSKNQDFKFPILGYSGYFLTKFFDTFKPLSYLLDRLETLWLRNDLNSLSINKPVYITGLARSGTTIILEMLHHHPDLATHRYSHLLLPYLPHWFIIILNKLSRFFLKKYLTKPYERVHKDRIIITRDSPEMVEETIWQQFFDNIHDEEVSNIINKETVNLKFEKFYKTHINKLIINQNRSRYLAKNNYNITRLEYLLKIFPNAKFILTIRNPVEHIASLIKQTELFLRMEREAPLLIDWLRVVGHYEFGSQQVCINSGNTDIIHKIRKLWEHKETYVKGWAYYWDSIYGYITNCLDTSKKLKKATYIVRYDDLCATPAEVIDKIIEHTELTNNKFKKVKNYYIQNLQKPTYYTSNFTEQELDQIYEITKTTANWFKLKDLREGL
ncbi:MAG: sulfotransferase [Promethearchaeota archaeon]